MKRTLLCLLAATLTLCAANKPKLIVTVVVDQFRYDYLTRYRGEYTGGFSRLLTRGAVFTNARYMHVPAVTAVGHSTVLSGAIPSISGIVANDWYDFDEHAHVTSVSDAKTRLVGGKDGTGSSPNRLLVSTVGDEMKFAAPGTHIIGISLKDRAAILPSGHAADAAYWFDPASGNFVTSTFYAPDLPEWAKRFNAERPADKLAGVTWQGHTLPAAPRLYSALEATPYGNELVEAFAERAVAAEQLGRHAAADLLTVSFSSNDYVGHQYGPESPEAHDVSLRTDQLLGKLLDAIDRQVGAENVLVVFTADHGAPPLPEANAARKMPGGRIPPASIREAILNAITKHWGAGEWIAGSWDLAVYLNRDLIAQKGLKLGEVEAEAADAVAALPHIFRVYTRDRVTHGETLHDEITQRVANGFNVRRAPDLEVIPDPYWIITAGKSGISHALPFSYDLHVPVIFMGTGIRAGRYNEPVVVNDIAPTLATMMDIETPSGSVGRVLNEILLP
ncbi:MAG: alkaline phosphatase family protein [Acidobacteria bacterium]|nr:alkaline phosphatase family protein [Acidobacteriota bacterium]